MSEHIKIFDLSYCEEQVLVYLEMLSKQRSLSDIDMSDSINLMQNEEPFSAIKGVMDNGYIAWSVSPDHGPPSEILETIYHINEPYEIRFEIEMNPTAVSLNGLCIGIERVSLFKESSSLFTDFEYDDEKFDSTFVFIQNLVNQLIKNIDFDYGGKVLVKLNGSDTWVNQFFFAGIDTTVFYIQYALDDSVHQDLSYEPKVYADFQSHLDKLDCDRDGYIS